MGDGGPGDGPGAALVLEALSPTRLTGVAGAPLSEDCVVRATRGGAPVPDVAIEFGVLSGGGSVKPGFVRTGQDGRAQARWTLGFGGQGQVLRASTREVTPVTFTADPVARPLSFAPAQGSPFSAGSNPYGLKLGKLDSDGRPDVVVALRSAGEVAVLRNLGGGMLRASQTFKTGSGPQAVALGRLNGDAIDDVVTANSNAENVTVLFGTEDGNLTSRNDYAVCREPLDVVIGDFDGAGGKDLAVSCFRDNQVAVLLGKFGGLFTEGMQVFPVGARPMGLAAGDLNGDAGEILASELSKPDFLDLVVAQSSELAAGSSDHTVGVLLGTSGLAFEKLASYRAQRGPLDIKLGDLNGDGKTDAVVSNTTSRSLSLLPGNGAGQLLAPTQIPLGDVPGYLALHDMDGDGSLDIVLSVPTKNQVEVLLNNGKGAFVSGQHFAVGGGSPRGVAVGDMNEDGMPDIVVANGATNDITVLLRQ